MKNNKDVDSLSHTTWRCQYHVVFAPKYRRIELFSSVLSGYFANALLYEHAYLLTSGKDMLLTLLNVEMMIGR